MTYSMDSLFWGDSELKKIEVEYDKITVTVFNDVLQKILFLECRGYAALSEIVLGDEVYIDSIKLFKSADTHLTEKANRLYERMSLDDPAGSDFWELHILMVNDAEFHVVCKQVDIHD